MSMKVGIQLFSVKESMEKDPVGTLKAIGEMGYRYLEFANRDALNDAGCGFGVDAKTMKEILERYDMKVVSAHIGPYSEAMLDRILEYHAIIGNQALVFTPTPNFTKKDMAYIIEQCDTTNRIGKRAKEFGLNLMYHNHWVEYTWQVDEKLIQDIIDENTDPDYLKYEIDTYWAMRGGVDIYNNVLKKYGKRIKMLHVKDFPKETTEEFSLVERMNNLPADIIEFSIPISRQYILTNPDRSEGFTEIGQGRLDIQAIIDCANEYTGAEYAILEQDATKLTELESIKVSMDGFRKFSGIEWDK